MRKMFQYRNYYWNIRAIFEKIQKKISEHSG